MATEFRLPDLGENIESGDVVNVLVSEGDTIKAEQGVVELETDKAVVEVPCPHPGKVVTIHIKKGDTVPVGGLILTLEGVAQDKAAEKKPNAPAAKKAEAASAKEKPQPAAKIKDEEPETNGAEEAKAPPARKPEPVAERRLAPQPEVEQDDDDGGLAAPAGPATRRLARELGVDLARVHGTGSGGRITREDVVAAVRASNASAARSDRFGSAATNGGAKAAPASKAPAKPTGTPGTDPYGTVRRERLSKIRKTIAVNMARSSSTIPHVTNFDDADITELEQIRKASTPQHDGVPVKLTMLAFVIKAVAQSLKSHPALNCVLDLEAEEVIYKEYVNVGVAVDTERGLVVPVMRGVDRLSIPQIGQGLGIMSQQARSAQFAIEDLRGGTFTISNLGAVGGAYSTPIINHPEVAVLLVGRSRMLPKWVEDKFVPRLMMPLSLSYDHRIVDGATAARFLNEVIDYLQTPGRLLLAM